MLCFKRELGESHVTSSGDPHQRCQCLIDQSPGLQEERRLGATTLAPPGGQSYNIRQRICSKGSNICLFSLIV